MFVLPTSQCQCHGPHRSSGCPGLSLNVTYWDQLGWKDTFAQPAFTARQWDYAHGLHHPNVFTPQVVVNGRRDGVGADPRELRSLVAAGDRGPGGPAISFQGQAVAIGPAAGAPADVWLVRYDPRLIQVPVGRGENAGRTLPHRNVVRELVRLGRWTGCPGAFALPARRHAGLKDAILVQAGAGGPIVAAARN